MATILIIDDEPIIRQLFQKVLEHEGHTVLTAGNGHEAIDVLRDQIPDLMLLDMMMPQMDGMSLLRLIRRNPMWIEIPVVVMSALADKQRICDAGSLGVRDYLLKAGFSLPMLRTRIRKYLNPQLEVMVGSKREASGIGAATMVE